MTPRAILFGSIGTLVETSELQRRAFNEAFREASLDWYWSPELYRSLLKRPGGRDRIARFAAGRGEQVDSSAIHDRKTEVFNQMVVDEGLSARPGVVDVIEKAKTVGIALGFATTTSRRNVDAIFSGFGGVISPADFSYVGHQALISNVKPSPDIYLDAIEELGVSSRQAIAIEDTESSLASATAAGVPCIAFPGFYASEQPFSEAVIVTPKLTWQVIESASHENAVLV
ncbi:MAG: HAD-IA family hydrolase [Pseudomonadota bacterium]